MKVIILQDYDTVSRYVAEKTVEAINTHQQHSPHTPFVLGLPTGGTIIGTYAHLIQCYEQKKVSFKNVISFNMDEYVGLAPSHAQSYLSFMHTHFFDHVDMLPENINMPEGTSKDLEASAAAYEQKIRAVGGIDLFLGGIGKDGHLAFNEPGSSLSSRTRIKTLTHETRIANARFFNNNVDEVPHMAMTVGIQTVMDAQEVLVAVNGYEKAMALQKIIEEGINHMYTASMLQMHPNTSFVCDEDATENLMVKTYRYFKSLHSA